MKGTKSDRETLRARVKAALGDRTQKDLEQELEVSGGTLSRVFGGRRNVDAPFLRSLAEALQIDVRRLLHGTDFLLLFDEAELPREAAEVDVVAPLPPEPGEGPAPIQSLPSRGGRPADAPPPEPVAVSFDDPPARAEAPTATLPRRSEQTTVPLAERDTEPTVTAVEAPVVDDPTAEEADHDRGSDDEGREAPQGIGGRLRRFFSNLFGG